jgi:hypothetical protein
VRWRTVVPLYGSGHIFPTNIPDVSASQYGQWDRYR